MRFTSHPSAWALRFVSPLLFVVLFLPPASAAQERRGGGAIQVHGHWSIAIRTARGEEIARYEFENALVDPQNLVVMLPGVTAAQWFGQWIVNIGPNICDTQTSSGTVAGDCMMAPPRPQGAAGTPPLNFFGNLTYAASPLTQSFTLAGSAVAAHDGQITTVYTILQTCSSNSLFTSTTQACMAETTKNYGNFTGNVFTSRDLTVPTGSPALVPPPILVKQGQTIDVTVTISFS